MKRAPYGTWPSPIVAEVAVSSTKGYANLQAAHGSLVWIESRPDEGGRSTLVRHGPDGRAELTPAPFNVRSRVHEYGGGAYCVADRHVYFVNFADQNIYVAAIDPDQVAPAPVTRGDSAERFADLVFVRGTDGARRGDHLLAVREIHGAGANEPQNDLVRIDLDGGITSLHRGHDFYAAPRPSADGRLAFLVWDHPNMPWDGTQLLVADYGGDLLTNAVVVAGGVAESVVQPLWCGTAPSAGGTRERTVREAPDAAEQRLLFASDANGFWNLYAYDRSGVYCVLEDEAEYAGPAWQFAASYFAAVGEDHLVARRIADGKPSLVVVDIARGLATPLDERCSSYADIVRSAGGVAFIAGFAERGRCVAELTLDTRQWRDIAAASKLPVADDVVSSPEPIAFASDTGDAHAFFYAPRNGDYRGVDGELPPLLVTTHGGPTASAAADLSWRVQFYTSRGWAVADVNYGGSTGYGRAYRERLHQAWGLVDVQDCVACVRHLVADGRVDPARVAIRGGSAGGYTTLAALTFANVFRAGASHYGIGDLAALSRDTHKFESRYVEALIGGADAIRERSPINHIDQLDCPVIFFQGADDEIVPRNQSETMRDALAAKGIEVEYRLFEGEGHGFRRAGNIRTALQDEYAFFARVFGIPATEPSTDSRADEAT